MKITREEAYNIAVKFARGDYSKFRYHWSKLIAAAGARVDCDNCYDCCECNAYNQCQKASDKAEQACYMSYEYYFNNWAYPDYCIKSSGKTISDALITRHIEIIARSNAWDKTVCKFDVVVNVSGLDMTTIENTVFE